MDEKLISPFQEFLENYSVTIQQKIEERVKKIISKKGYITKKDIDKIINRLNKKSCIHISHV